MPGWADKTVADRHPAVHPSQLSQAPALGVLTFQQPRRGGASSRAERPGSSAPPTTPRSPHGRAPRPHGTPGSARARVQAAPLAPATPEGSAGRSAPSRSPPRRSSRPAARTQSCPACRGSASRGRATGHLRVSERQQPFSGRFLRGEPPGARRPPRALVIDPPLHAPIAHERELVERAFGGARITEDAREAPTGGPSPTA